MNRRCLAPARLQLHFTRSPRALRPREDSPMSENASLTSRQQEIYDFICHRIDQRGFPPTIRDIGTAFDIKSPNGVRCHLKAIENKGFMSRAGNSAWAVWTSRLERVRQDR